MPVINFSFTNISGERRPFTSGGTTVKNAVVMKDITKTKVSFGPQSQDVLRITFEFTSDYEPNHGNITFRGEVLYLDKPEKLDALAKSWQKDKKMPKDEGREIGNHVLGRCNVEAILLSRELGLPSPIELPRLGK